MKVWSHSDTLVSSNALWGGATEDAGLDDVVVLEVRFPPGSAAGPPIDRREVARRGVESGPGFRAYIAANSVTWQPGKTRVVIPKSGDRRTWSKDPDAYPVLTRQDRNRLAFGANDNKHRTVAEIDGPWEDLPGIEIVDRKALDRDGRLGWRIVPTVAEVVQQIRAVDRPT